jgi:hypothetical protein
MPPKPPKKGSQEEKDMIAAALIEEERKRVEAEEKARDDERLRILAELQRIKEENEAARVQEISDLSVLALLIDAYPTLLTTVPSTACVKLEAEAGQIEALSLVARLQAIDDRDVRQSFHCVFFCFV